MSVCIASMRCLWRCCCGAFVSAHVHGRRETAGAGEVHLDQVPCNAWYCRVEDALE